MFPFLCPVPYTKFYVLLDIMESELAQQPSSGKTCIPVHIFSLFGNHYYKCQGKWKFYVHPLDAEI